MTHNHHKHNDDTLSLSFEEKLIKLFEHWIRHNNEHAETYRKWSRSAKDNGYHEISTLIEEAVNMARHTNQKFTKALERLK